MKRRHFLKLAGAAAPVIMLAPGVAASGPQGARRVLVMIELKGGNDGLNTVVPYADPAYALLRPTIGLNKGEVIKLDEKTGLHPSLKDLKALWDQKELAVVQGVGYADPNRSHFRSIDIWETGSDSAEFLQTGWLTRTLGSSSPQDNLLDGVSIRDQSAGPLRGNARALTIADPAKMAHISRKLLKKTDSRSENEALMHVLQTQQDVLRAASGIEARLESAPPLGAYKTSSKFDEDLRVAAQLILGDVPLVAIRIVLSGFDTHANQLGAHRRHLLTLSQGLKKFRDVLKKHGQWEHTLVMTYSEFGRRAAQNASRGTDHGTAAPHFMMGGSVKGGLYGKAPSLTDLAGGDLKHHVDFRSMYATASTSWLGLDAHALAGHRPLPIV